MPRLEESKFGFLFRTEAFLVGFVILAVVNAGLAWVYPAAENPLHVRLISVFVYSVLGWYAHKRQRVSTLVLCFLMLFTGVGTLFPSFTALVAGASDQPGMLLVNLFVGGYFTYGGIRLFLDRPKPDGAA